MASNAYGDVVDKYAAAEYLKISVHSVERRAQEGVIGNKVGKVWRFKMSELSDYADGIVRPRRQPQEAQHGSVSAGDVRTN